jgi:hypothetical protein
VFSLDLLELEQLILVTQEQKLTFFSVTFSYEIFFEVAHL